MKHRFAVIITSTIVCLTMFATATPVSLAAPSSPPSAGPSVSAASSTTAMPESKEQAPLVLVVDVSESMTENDSSGRNKLSSAKKTMSTLVQGRPESTDLGVWTYPGGTTSGECAPGSWIPGLQPDQHPDPTDVDAHIRQLTASGNTPTGPALRGVVDSLKQKGFTSATLLLISDGESNCGEPPCEVAKSIVDEGFALSVPSIGFTISDKGRDELTCISQATGSSYREADNADQLIKELSQYEQRDLEVSVEAPTRIRQGANAAITATIKNSSHYTVTNIRAAISIDPGTSRTIFPLILSPVRHLPALKEGESTRVTWAATGASGQTGTAGWKVAVGSRDAGSVLKTGKIEVTDEGLTLNDAGPLLQDVSGPVVVIGDSFSSGEGAGSYLDEGEPKCHRAQTAYGAVLGGRQTHLIACSGAVTADVTDKSQHPSEPPQAKALQDIPDNPGLVYLTIGGNDIHFGDIVTGCILGNCTADRAEMTRRLSDIPQRKESLKKTYRAVMKAANTRERVKKRQGKVAPLIVSPYPDPLWEKEQGNCATVMPNVSLSPSEISYGRQILTLLNRTVRDAVTELSKEGYPVYYAQDVVDLAKPNHTICNSDSYFVKVNLQNYVHDRNELFHPNISGHEAWAQSLIAWSQTKEAQVVNTTMPNEGGGLRSAAAGGLKRLGRAVQPPQDHALTAQLQPLAADGSASRQVTTTTVRNGDTLTLTVTGVNPGSTVTVTVHSDIQTLGTLTADANGKASGTLALTADIPSGNHTLVLEGLKEDAQMGYYEIPLSVRETSGWLVLLAYGITLLLIACGAMTLVLSRRRRHHLAAAPTASSTSVAADVVDPEGADDTSEGDADTEEVSS
ncbi:VWA domain-containing protein [Actinomyces sp. HMT 175]|uniref:VWA domain-containing protein n=1 Tax=Actinomyces sp. HMT 175 TaxID=2789425 RepID=UPI00191721E4|nr:VWA domain-containing protein [Actinomyces sp. HMT 175]QQQ60405.1 VWA domain-containing protein [Actinomyces sp. HMT 175]